MACVWRLMSEIIVNASSLVETAPVLAR